MLFIIILLRIILWRKGQTYVTYKTTWLTGFWFLRYQISWKRSRTMLTLLERRWKRQQQQARDHPQVSGLHIFSLSKSYWKDTKTIPPLPPPLPQTFSGGSKSLLVVQRGGSQWSGSFDGCRLIFSNFHGWRLNFRAFDGWRFSILSGNLVQTLIKSKY